MCSRLVPAYAPTPHDDYAWIVLDLNSKNNGPLTRESGYPHRFMFAFQAQDFCDRRANIDNPEEGDRAND